MTTVSVGTVVGEVEGDGFPVVMIHGLGGSTNMFQPQVAALAGKRIIRLDLPGSSRSPRPAEALTIDGMTSAVLTAVRDPVASIAVAAERGRTMGEGLVYEVAGGVGTVTIDGTGTVMRLVAAGEMDDGSGNGIAGAQAAIGRNGGTGTLNLTVFGQDVPKTLSDIKEWSN